jgi:hypothetical protein
MRFVMAVVVGMLWAAGGAWANGHIGNGAGHFPAQATPQVLPPLNPASPSRNPGLVPGRGNAGGGSNPVLRGPTGTPGAPNFPLTLPR